MFEILEFFPKNISEILYQYINNDLEEIRIRVNNYIILSFFNHEQIVQYKINSEEILNILQKICDNSIYAYQNQICERRSEERRVGKEC